MSFPKEKFTGKKCCEFCCVLTGEYHEDDCELMKKIRTNRQNRALHLYFEMLARALNDAGLDMRKVLKPEVDIPFTKETVKEFLWRPIQKLMFGKVSTTDLERKEIDPIFETVNRHLAKFGVHKPFPSVDAIFEELRLLDSKKLK